MHIIFLPDIYQLIELIASTEDKHSTIANDIIMLAEHVL
jgi:hypothetical protein